MNCVALSMVRVATSKLGPVCDSVGFDLFQSKRHKAVRATNPSNYREENGFRLTSYHSAKSQVILARVPYRHAVCLLAETGAP
jgi:hypothetical protein